MLSPAERPGFAVMAVKLFQIMTSCTFSSGGRSFWPRCSDSGDAPPNWWSNSRSCKYPLRGAFFPWNNNFFLWVGLNWTCWPPLVDGLLGSGPCVN